METDSFKRGYFTTRIVIKVMRTALVIAMWLMSEISVFAQEKVVKSRDTFFSGTMCINTAPEYPGGEKALLNFLQKEVEKGLKQLANKEAPKGQAIISYKIDSLGKVAEISIAKGIRSDIDSMLVHVVGSMQKWKPAFLIDKTVSVTLRQKFTFL